MKLPNVGDTYLVTTSNWFSAPDGNTYKSVYGTVHGIFADTTLFGLKTNKNSTNWYLSIGNMIIAGCQIYYAIKTDSVSYSPPKRDIEHNGTLTSCKENSTRIYNADT